MPEPGGQGTVQRSSSEDGALRPEQTLQHGLAPAAKTLHFITSVCLAEGLLPCIGHRRCREHVRCCWAQNEGQEGTPVLTSVRPRLGALSTYSTKPEGGSVPTGGVRNGAIRQCGGSSWAFRGPSLLLPVQI